MAIENINTLVPVHNHVIGTVAQQTTDARELHAFLGVPTKFNDWISRRIEEFSFVENSDFVLVTQKWETKGRGGNRKPTTEYRLTLDMAKELAMVEKNDKGREARRYFIACETRLKEALARQVDAGKALVVLDPQLRHFWVTTDAAGNPVKSVRLDAACKLVDLVDAHFPDAILMERDYMQRWTKGVMETVWEADKVLREAFFFPMEKRMRAG
jgi:phage anti-repressor protein